MKILTGKKTIHLYYVLVLVLLGLIVTAVASISPEELTATLRPCESITETKTVHVEEIPPKADVVFAFDLTGSMGDIIDTAKLRAQDIMDELDDLGIDIQYGVMSYMDYPHSYNYCDYSREYGTTDFGCGDYAYSLDQAVTDDRDAVISAITGLVLGCGSDGPQDYTRIFYESYADTNVAWRTGAKRILVNFGDNVPHDCDLNEGVPGTIGIWTTGGDPGRDEVMGNEDDLDLQTVLAEMSDAGVVLLECHTSSSANEHWDYWTDITGGGVYITGSGTLVDDVVTAVTDALEAPMVYGLHLEASAGFESWVSSVPDAYDEVEPCNEVTFEVTIHVPEGTAEGEYSFTISAMDEVGVSYGDQSVIITVPSPVIPVDIDIKPTSCPNPLNVKSNGVLPVAILGTEELDVYMIDVASILLEGVDPIRSNYEDVATPVSDGDECDCTTEGPDGYMDLTLKFETQEIVAAIGDVNSFEVLSLTLDGVLYDGTPIQGSDCIIVLKGGPRVQRRGR